MIRKGGNRFSEQTARRQKAATRSDDSNERHPAPAGERPAVTVEARVFRVDTNFQRMARRPAGNIARPCDRKGRNRDRRGQGRLQRMARSRAGRTRTRVRVGARTSARSGAARRPCRPQPGTARRHCDDALRIAFLRRRLPVRPHGFDRRRGRISGRLDRLPP
jgi:hypothetical protein